jgi:hypothetical protein
MDGVARSTDVFVGLNNVGCCARPREGGDDQERRGRGEKIACPPREKAAPVRWPPGRVEP